MENLNNYLVAYDDIKNEKDLECWAREEIDNVIFNVYIDGNKPVGSFGQVPFYMEVKPGFQQYKEQIIERLEKAGLSVVAQNTINRTRKFNKVFYQNLLDRPEIWDVCNTYMTGKMKHPYIKERGVLEGPTIGLLVVGDVDYDPIETARKLQGKTGSPDKGTIRYDFALRDENGNPKPHITANVLHCSDSIVNGIKEVYQSFCDCEKYGMMPDISYNNIEKWLVAENLVKTMYEKIVAKEQQLASQNAPVVVEKQPKQPRKVNGGDRKDGKKHRGDVARKIIEAKQKEADDNTK